MKYCYDCTLTKPFDAFAKSSATKDGHNAQCKTCAVEAARQRTRTRRGLVKKIYHNQRMTSKKMGRPMPAYSEDQLFDWMVDHGYETLWRAWTDSGHDKWLSPSIDRKDNNKNYTLDNIQLITWRENLDNYVKHNELGIQPRPDMKPVAQYTKDGQYIKTHLSAAIAAREMVGHNRNVSNITAVCHGKAKTAYGYQWRFA